MYPDSQFRQELARERYADLLREAQTERLASLRRELEATPLDRSGGFGERLLGLLRPRGRRATAARSAI